MLDSVNNATTVLMTQNASYLINFIYNNTSFEPYNDRQIRVGLVLKMLLKSNEDTFTDGINMGIMAPVLDDMATLIREAPDNKARDILTEELKYIQSRTLLDDLISLNTQRGN